MPSRIPESLRLILIATSAPESPLDLRAVEAAVQGGVTLVQARGKGMSTGELLDLARGLVALCARGKLPLVVNDRPDVALAAGAAGCHVGPDDLPPLAARKVLGDLILGVSARNLERVSLAEAARANYLGVGAFRVTASKPQARVLGVDGIAALARRTAIPVVAIGGVLPADLPALARAKVAGVAVGAGILGARDPEAAARAYRAAWPV